DAYCVYVIKKQVHGSTSTNGDPKDQLRPIHDPEGPSAVFGRELSKGSRGCTGQGLTTRQTNGAYQITIKDDYGGLEVILDVYFPLHVTSL
ncbi:hypothetical protein U9M48_008702, partial [Paspalum notatum var. saurae]